MTLLPPDTPEGIFRDHARRLNRMERRTNRKRTAGTVAMRDEWYGIPGTDAEKVALAGQRWWDSALGIWFKYYAGASIAGVAPGSRASASGWYPDEARMPMSLMDLQANQAFAAGADVKVNWRTTAGGYDPFGMFDLANNRWTLPWAGLWGIRYKLRSSTHTTGINMTIRRNGANYTRLQTSAFGGTSSGTTAYVDGPMYADAGATVEAFCNTPSALTITAAHSFIQLTYEGPAPS